MFPKKNGIGALEVDTDETPMMIWQADLWECPECGGQVISGFSKEGVEHWEGPLFTKLVSHHKENNTLYTIKQGA